MAVTEKNQWLHILLIIFVMLAIAGGVGTYLGVTSAQAAYEAEQDAKTKLANETFVVKLAEDVASVVLAYAGPPDVDTITIEEADNLVARVAKNTEGKDTLKIQFSDPLQQVKSAYENDMLDAPEGVETWRALATYLVTVVNSKNKTIEEKDDERARIKAEADTKVTEAETAKVAALAAEQAAKKALEDAKVVFDTKVQELQSKFDTLTTTTNDNLKIVQQELQKEQSEKKQLRSVITVRENTIAVQSNIIENYRRTDFDIPDGRVTSVKGNQKQVWVNLGYLDALPTQLKFNVYDSQAAELNEAAKKAEIKILRVVGPHTSEAIIIESDDLNPILPDDYIFTSTWTPGQRTKYYLAGMFDIDGDGKSDQDRVKALLIRAGGEIVGELTQDGVEEGQKIDPNIRFLVYGGKPEDPNLSNKVDAIREKANQEGVKSIGIDQLMINLGLGSEARIISGGVEKKNNSFRQRRPTNIPFGN